MRRAAFFHLKIDLRPTSTVFIWLSIQFVVIQCHYLVKSSVTVKIEWTINNWKKVYWPILLNNIIIGPILNWNQVVFTDEKVFRSHLLLTSNGIRKLTGINGRLTSENYINLLENQILTNKRIVRRCGTNFDTSQSTIH